MRRRDTGRGTSIWWFEFYQDLILDCVQLAWDIMDATQTQEKGSSTVVLKAVDNTSHPNEIAILQFFASEELRNNPRNHCVPLYDVFADTVQPSVSLLVMQPLRPFDDPGFVAIGEVLDFVKQTLDVSVFLGLCGDSLTRVTILGTGVSSRTRHGTPVSVPAP